MSHQVALARYRKAVQFLEGLGKIDKSDYMKTRGEGRELFLKRLRVLLDRIGNPERTIPNFIHVGGTSGKGTTTMTIAEALLSRKERVGAYTSPHVTTTAERFWVNGALMHPKTFAALVEWIKPHLLWCDRYSPYGLPSYFEILFALALEHFRREGVEWAIVEVGCGGEFDATNVIPPARATIITNVGLDHTNILGSTKIEIAKTKSKIIKPGTVAFTMEESPRIRRVIQDTADKVKAPLYSAKNLDELLDKLSPVLGALDRPDRVSLPGRLEIMQRAPMVLLDVAHNPDKVQYLVDRLPKKKWHVLFGCAANKDARTMLETLIPFAKTLTFAPFQTSDRACFDPGRLEDIAKKIKPSQTTHVFLDANEALDSLLVKKYPASRPDPILVTGSFFLVADVRTRWILEDDILTTQNPFGKRNSAPSRPQPRAGRRGSARAGVRSKR